MDSNQGTSGQPLEDGTPDGYTGATGDETHLIPGKSLVGTGVDPAAMESGEVMPLQMEEKKQKTCNVGGLRVIIISAISFSVVVTIALIITIYFGPSQVPVNVAVASDIPACSEVGTDIMHDGGSAVDAVVATTLCVGVVSPSDSGIGGAGYLLVRDNAHRRSVVFDFMATAPSGATKEMFDGNIDDAQKGGKAVAVPGLLKGLWDAHQMFGSLKWSRVVKPAADVARNGFNVTKKLADAIQNDLTATDQETYARLAEEFTIDGEWVKVGDTLKRTKLAEVLDSIGANGVVEFYEGTYANEIADTVQDNNGLLQPSDMRSYTTTTTSPIDILFHNITVQSVPTPAAGPVVLGALNILDNFEWSNISASENTSYHYFIESLRFAFSVRGLLGDPAFEPDVVDTQSLVLNASHAKLMAASMGSDTTHEPDYYGNTLGLTTTEGTSQISVFGPREQMASITVSLGQSFGSRVMTPSGILLNSFMSQFSVPNQQQQTGTAPNMNNFIEPGKRPATDMAPTVTFSQDKPCRRRIALGGEGGTQSLSGIIEVILRVVGFRESLKDAIDAPRLHDQLLPEGVDYEVGLSDKVVDYLSSMGHDMQQKASPFNVVNAVAKINETVDGYADERGGGEASVLRLGT